MAISPLATQKYAAHPSNFTAGRPQGAPDHITVHHMAGVLSAAQCGAVFQRPGRGGSAHYGIGNGGEIANYVDENDTAWSDSNWNSNCKTISIETANSENGGEWPVGEAAFNSLVKLVADIAKRNGLGRLVPGVNLCWHSMYAQTTCVPIDTEVLTRDGWKTIAEVEEGEDIASVHIDDLSIDFLPVLGKVPEKEQDTWEARGIEVTSDHNMLWKTQGQDRWRVSQFKDLPKDCAVYLPNAGYYAGKGLPLSDNEIKLLIAIQADGHYEHGEKSGENRVTFHVSKDRKIALLDEILKGYDYKKYHHKDGTVSYNIKDIKSLCDEWLDNKQFTFNWLELSPEQAKLFLDTLLDFDGCRAGNDYSSSEQQNIDVVDAIAAINGVGVRHNGDKRTVFIDADRTITKDSDRKRHQKTIVSCVTVSSGFILVRQHGRTTVIGNCPGNHLRGRMHELAERANAINEAAPAPEPAPQPNKSNETIADEVIRGDWGNGEDRKARLATAGYDYAAVQAIVNQKLAPQPAPAPAPAPEPFKVGDTVVPTRLVDYNGTPLVQYDQAYTIAELSGNRAVLTARGAVWAAMRTEDIRRA